MGADRHRLWRAGDRCRGVHPPGAAERAEDRGQEREPLATVGHETMLRMREPASAEAVAGGPLPDRRQQETRSRTAWGALRRVRPRGGKSRLQSGGPRNPWASLSAVRFRVEGQLMEGSDRGQGATGYDPANTDDFPVGTPWVQPVRVASVGECRTSYTGKCRFRPPVAGPSRHRRGRPASSRFREKRRGRSPAAAR